MPKSAAEVLSAWNILHDRYNGRDTRYKAAWYAYNGEYDKINPLYQYNRLKDYRAKRESQVQIWNLVFPIVEAHRILTNKLPAIEVDAVKMGDPLAAKFSEKQERMLYCLWDNSEMKMEHSDGSFNAALWNSTTWFTRWDQEKELPVITARQPGETYPVFKRSGKEVAYCLFVFKMDEDQLAEMYPEAKKLLTSKKRVGNSRTEVEVIEYIDADQYGIVIGGDYASLQEGGATKLNYCPVVITPGAYVKGDDGRSFPPSGIDQIVSINDLLNRFQTKWHDALEEVLRPGVILRGPGAENIVWDTGPGAMNVLPEDVEYIPPQYPQLPQEVFVHLQRMEQVMRTIANFPNSASGEMDNSIVTGQAVRRLQGIMTAKAAETQDSFARGLTKCNEYMLRMLETYRPDKKYTLYSTDSISSLSAPGRKKTLSVELVPSEDINKTYRSRLVYSPLGIDTGLALTLGMQLVEADVVSRRWLRNQISGLGDAEGMGDEIEEEKRRRLQLEVDLQVLAQTRMAQATAQAQAQAQQQAQQGAAPQEGGPPVGNAPQTQGGSAPPAPQTPPGGMGTPQQIGNTTVMPGGEPTMMGPGPPITGAKNFPIPYTPLKPLKQGVDMLYGGAPGQGAPAGPQSEAMPGKTVVTAQEVAQALSGATNRKGEKASGKLKGQVYFLGDMAQRGWSDGKIELGITVQSDQQIIVNALPQYAAQGLLSFRVLTTVPPDAVPIEEVANGNEQSKQVA